MDRDQSQSRPAEVKPSTDPQSGESVLRSPLGRDKPGEGLDTGVATGAINPGQSGSNGQADKN